MIWYRQAENYFNPSFSFSSNLGVFDDGAEKFPGVKLMKSFRLSPCKLTFESEHLEGERAALPENDCTAEREREREREMGAVRVPFSYVARAAITVS